jgi:hypothetical protein
MKEIEKIEPKEKPSKYQAYYYEEFSTKESHADTFACTMHASQESKREPHTSYIILIFFEKHLQKQIGYLNSSRENIQFQKKVSYETKSGK